MLDASASPSPFAPDGDDRGCILGMDVARLTADGARNGIAHEIGQAIGRGNNDLPREAMCGRPLRAGRRATPPSGLSLAA